MTVAATVFSVCFDAFAESAFTYLTVADGQITVTGCSSLCPEELTIPEKIDGQTVVGIGDYAFSDEGLRTVDFPPTLVSIGRGAFRDNEIEESFLPQGVSTIGPFAFSSNLLKQISLPQSLTAIEMGAFYNNKIESLTIAEGVTVIGIEAFSRNPLVEVSFPSTLIEISDRAFARTQLVEISFPNSLKTIGNMAFYSVEPSITSISLPDSFRTIGEDAFFYQQLEELVIPEGTISIGDGAFVHNNLRRVTLPNSLTVIQESVFRFNPIEDLVLGNRLIEIKALAFDNYRYCDGCKLTELSIPASVTSIAHRAFTGVTMSGATFNFLGEPPIVEEEAFPSNIKVFFCANRREWTNSALENLPSNRTAIDCDSDADGVLDSADAFPVNAAEQLDSDGDSVGDNSDNCPLFANPIQINTDGDADGDACDPDDDNDGFTDEEELADGTDPLSRFSCRSGCFNFDIDENSEAKALSDGLLVIRHLFGFSGSSLTSGATTSDGARTSAEAISSYLSDAEAELDIDGDGQSKALTDGLLLIRYLFGFSGDSLTAGAIGEGAQRATAEEIEGYIKARIPSP